MATTSSFAAAAPCLGHTHGRASLACRAASSPCSVSSSLRELSISSSAAGRALNMSRSSTARFISVLSVSSCRSVRRNAILALDPDFYRIPHKSGVPVGKRLQIWNLPPSLDKDEFLDWFNSINLPVESFELTDDPELNAQGIGGFIEFTTKQDACMAIVKRDGYKFNGRCIRMDFVEKKPHETPIGGRRNRPSFRSNSMGGGYETRPNPNYVPNPSYAAKNPDYVPNPNYVSKSQTSPSYGTGNSGSGYGMGAAGTASSGYGSTVPTVQSSPSYASSSPLNPSQSTPTGTATSGYGTGNASSGYANTVSTVQSAPSYTTSIQSAPSGTASSGYGTGTASLGYGSAVSTEQPSTSYSSISPSGAVNPTQSAPSSGNPTESTSSSMSDGYSGYDSRPRSFGNQSYGNPGYGGPSYGTGNVSSGAGSSMSTVQSSPSYTSSPSGAVNPTQSAPSFGNSTDSTNSGTSGGYNSYDSRPSFGNQSYGNPSYGGPSYGTGPVNTGYGGAVQSSPSYSGNFPSGAVNPTQSAPSFGNSSESTSSEISGGYSSYESRPSFGNPSYGNSSYGGSSYGSPRPFSSNRVFVGNLPWSADDMKLQEIFSKHGTVLEARIVKDRETGRSRGFGFVSMSTPDEMQAAIQALDGSPMDGRPLKVNEASARF